MNNTKVLDSYQPATPSAEDLSVAMDSPPPYQPTSNDVRSTTLLTMARFGNETLSHITRAHIDTILAEIGRNPSERELANATTMVVTNIVRLIYSVPINQPLYTLSSGVLISQTSDGWDLKTDKGEVVVISWLICKLMYNRMTDAEKKVCDNSKHEGSRYLKIYRFIRYGQDAGYKVYHKTAFVYI